MYWKYVRFSGLHLWDVPMNRLWMGFPIHECAYKLIYRSSISNQYLDLYSHDKFISYWYIIQKKYVILLCQVTPFSHLRLAGLQQHRAGTRILRPEPSVSKGVPYYFHVWFPQGIPKRQNAAKYCFVNFYLFLWAIGLKRPLKRDVFVTYNSQERHSTKNRLACRYSYSI